MTDALRPPKFPYDFPLRENCEPDNPYQAFLWMQVAPPGLHGAPLLMNISYLQLMSKRLWDLGSRPVEQPILKYRRPLGSDPNWIYSPGSWVPIDAPDDDPRTPARRAADVYTSIQKAELMREFAKDMTPREQYEFARRLAGQEGGDPS